MVPAGATLISVRLFWVRCAGTFFPDSGQGWKRFPSRRIYCLPSADDIVRYPDNYVWRIRHCGGAARSVAGRDTPATSRRRLRLYAVEIATRSMHPTQDRWRQRKEKSIIFAAMTNSRAALKLFDDKVHRAPHPYWAVCFPS